MLRSIHLCCFALKHPYQWTLWSIFKTCTAIFSVEISITNIPSFYCISNKKCSNEGKRMVVVVFRWVKLNVNIICLFTRKLLYNLKTRATQFSADERKSLKWLPWIPSWHCLCIRSRSRINACDHFIFWSFSLCKVLKNKKLEFKVFFFCHGQKRMSNSNFCFF